MDFKDYYSILGVPKDADDKTIKKAYQKLAKKYHPDVNPGNKEAEEKFKEVTEAYEAIGDPEKRRKYEEVRQNYEAWQNSGGRGNYDWSRWQAQPGQGSYTRTMSPEEFAEMFGDFGLNENFNSGGGFSDFFSTLFGMGDRGQGTRYGRHTSYTQPQAGQDRELDISVSLEEAYLGTTRVLEIGGKRIEAKIPKGVRTGSKVRLAGQGNPGLGGGANGDFYLVITVKPHSAYSREGDDLTTEGSISFYRAIFGGEMQVKTLNGEVTLKIPPHTQGNTRFRLKGKGMPHLENSKHYGDLYVNARLILPDDLSKKEIDELREIAHRYHHL
ncbi:DnaJ C-terminal domain-containing protein [Desulfitobacterium sp.]|uniref:DnaJ C-terminal domain-containing protein n=1 Tax=Desulfitobacterium sp. TaxID=49981 RepID=UPI002B21305A|nr:DnaJ C-terminal domain-containing protein [Desulfitobacterium sp.]MEA4902104.1 DnaJ C-terminal domain-containing protein [Desulfitobacterium sp.]